MKFKNTELEGVKLIKPSVFDDYRGQFIEIFNNRIFKENKLRTDFVQDDISVSSKHVLRGIHGDGITWKLVTCLYGSVYAVIVDCRDKMSFGKWVSFTLTDSNRNALLVPPFFGNSYLVLSDMAIYYYKQSTYYNTSDPSKFAYRWNHQEFNIHWPIDNPILSEKDLNGKI